MLHGVVRNGKRHLLPLAVWYGMEEEEEGNTHLLVLKRERRMDHPLHGAI